MKLVNKFALSFNDILLVPQFNEIKSRLDTDLSTRLTNHINIKHVICSSNMSTITEFEMMKTLYQSGSAGFLHRFMSHEKILNTIIRAKEAKIYPIVISVGVKDTDCSLVDRCLSDANTTPNIFLIDIAHGDSISVVNMVKYIKKNCADKVDIIAGNISTKESAMRMADLGVNAIRCGIGGGSCCSTRTVTAFGVPLLQSIIDCKEGIDSGNYDIPIIADGGISCSGSIIKSICAGASSVSLGGLLAATSDTPGEIIVENGIQKKKMYGMSSKDANEIIGKLGVAAEGITRLLEYKGKTIDVLNELIASCRSALTYAGAKTIDELRENAEYMILSPGSMMESKFI